VCRNSKPESPEAGEGGTVILRQCDVLSSFFLYAVSFGEWRNQSSRRTYTFDDKDTNIITIMDQESLPGCGCPLSV
jgi:hypothetical protein